MLDGDGIEGLETVDGTNGIRFFLCYAEPVRAAQGVQALVYAGIHLCLNNFVNLIIDTWQYWNILLNPWGVCNDGDFNRQKEVLTLRVIPSKPFILERHEVV